jgi:hypothetical protein
MNNGAKQMINVGDMVEIGQGTAWGGKFEVLAIKKLFKNGVTAVVVNFHGKRKVFHI